jgi:DNA polymerase-3 subunit delta
MKLTETALKDSLKFNKLSNLYYFYGRESFLVKTYTDRVREKSAPDLDEFNLIKFTGLPEINALDEAIETLPVFAEKKVIIINDPDFEKTDADTLDRIITLFSDIPDYCTVIMAVTGFEPSKNAKTKKALTCIEKYGTVCEFDLMTKAQAAELILKKVSRLDCIISRTDAEYLYELTLGSLTLIGVEVEKLASYAGKGGVISKDTIDLLTPRLTETKTFDLATALTSGNAKLVFKILDDLMIQNVQPVMILATLSGTFVDYYRAKLGKNNGTNPAKIAADFNYPKNRLWVVDKISRSVSNISLDYIKNCLSILYKSDIKLKSTSLNNRTVIEKTMAEIILLR